MTQTDRLHAIQHLGAAIGQLSKEDNSTGNLARAVSELQGALAALNLQSLTPRDNSIKAAKQALGRN